MSLSRHGVWTHSTRTGRLVCTSAQMVICSNGLLTVKTFVCLPLQVGLPHQLAIRLVQRCQPVQVSCSSCRLSCRHTMCVSVAAFACRIDLESHCHWRSDGYGSSHPRPRAGRGQNL